MDYDELFNTVHDHITFKTPVLFYLQLDESFDNEYDFEICMRHLSLETQQKILNKKTPRDKKLKLANSLLLPLILSLNKGTYTSALDLKYSQYGKPYLEDIGFNISDEDDIVALVIGFNTKLEYGLDLANLKDIQRFNKGKQDFLQNFKDIFTPEELQYLIHLSDTKFENLILTYYWALKESYSKLLGLGLNESFQKFDFGDKVTKDVSYRSSDTTTILEGLIKYNSITWNNFSMTQLPKHYNYTTMLNPNIVCSVFSTESIEPIVIEIKPEFLIQFYKNME